MGKLISIIVFILLIGFILYQFGDSGQRQPEQLPAGSSSPEASAVAPDHRPSTQRPATAPSDYGPRLHAAAREAQVQLEILQITGNQVRVRVSWTSSSAAAGGDFIDLLVSKRLISNFDMAGQMQYGRDAQNRQQWTQEFMLRML